MKCVFCGYQLMAKYREDLFEGLILCPYCIKAVSEQIKMKEQIMKTIQITNTMKVRR